MRFGFIGLGLVLVIGAPTMTWSQTPTAEKGFPEVGTKIKVKVVDEKGERIKLWTVLGPGTYEKREVVRFSADVVDARGAALPKELMIFDPATRNRITTLLDGKEEDISSPHVGAYSWPLAVGKSWTARFNQWRADTRRTSHIQIDWKVAAYEEVQVQAGTFRAFRLEGKNVSVTRTIWYVPDLHTEAKSTADLYIAAGPSKGTYKTTSELLEYVKP